MNTRLTAALLCLLLSACGTQTTSQREPPVADNRDIERWRVSGKVGIKSDAEAHSAYINWRQCQDSFDIRLSGPLGQGAATLTGDQRHATLTSREGRWQGANPEALLSQQLGWPIPVSELLYWVRGLPAPGSDYQRGSEDTLQQAGWHIHYQRWHTSQGHRLPTKLSASHPRAKVTLILKQWQLDPECPR